MANPKVSVPSSAIPSSPGDSNNLAARIPSVLFSDITSALLSANAIPRIQAALQNELDATGWTTRIRKRVLQLLREEQCSTYDEVMKAVLAEVKADAAGDGKGDEDDDDEGSGQDADADGDDNEDGDGDDKDKSDRDAENDGDGSGDDGDDDDIGDDDDDDKDDKGSVASKATAKNRRKSNVSNAAASNGTSASTGATNTKRKAKSEARSGESKDKSRRHRQQPDTRGIKIPKRAVKEGLRVVRKELEGVCEIVPDSDNGG